MSIGMTPFRALYVYDALSFYDVMFGERKAPREKEWIQESQDILQALKENIATTQYQQKIYVYRGQIERQFEIHDLVYLHL